MQYVKYLMYVAWNIVNKAQHSILGLGNPDVPRIMSLASEEILNDIFTKLTQNSIQQAAYNFSTFEFSMTLLM